MLHSMTIRLVHMHQLETLYLCYGVKFQTAVIWSQRGRKVIFTKNAITCPCCIAWPYDSYMCISLRPSTYVIGSNVNMGSFEVTGIKRSFAPKCCSILSSLTIRLMDIHNSLRPSTCVMGSMVDQGSFGVTGVKKVIFTKILLFNSYIWYMVMELMHIHKLDPLYKIYGFKNHLGSFGVTWVKR